MPEFAREAAQIREETEEDLDGESAELEDVQLENKWNPNSEVDNAAGTSVLLKDVRYVAGVSKLAAYAEVGVMSSADQQVHPMRRAHRGEIWVQRCGVYVRATVATLP